MLLTLTTTHEPATDLGFLLHKHPQRLQTLELPFGSAHLFYPEATPERCTFALLIDVDPVGLVRDRKGPGGEGFALRQYVSDRPYAASSFLSVALSRTLGSALGGRSKGRQEVADTTLPLTARLTPLPCRGGEGFLRSLFEPLGYTVVATRHPLDTTWPAWGDSPYFSVELSRMCRLAELLTHLYVLVPVLDDDKHYWVGDDEVEKLLRHGEGWLSCHPERETIAYRYLKHRRSLLRQTLSRLAEDDPEDADDVASEHGREEETLERGLSLDEERRGAVLAVLKATGARRILDLGCGEGKLLNMLLSERQFTEILGVDVSTRALEIAARRLNLETLSETQRARIRLVQGALTYRDERLSGYDAAAVVEVVEHLDPHRLEAFSRVLFEYARPTTVALTTPNVEYNTRFPGLATGALRHRDHRFEWTRREFEDWSTSIAARFGYVVRFVPIGLVDTDLGSPTQMAVFTRTSLTTS